MNSLTHRLLLADEFELLKQEIIAAYETSDMESSGDWANSVKAEPTLNGHRLTAADYINGRDPGKPPPSEAIEEWIVKKGIAVRLEKNITLSSLAFLIARKIAKLGWRPKQGTEDIIEQVVTPQRIQQILDKVGESYLIDFTDQIINHIKQAAL
ncbi:hypothetical protein GR160_08600 [Flavobacterium sp. Sd200]|uniref:hypothetical protein n=1 Tax=Flavobacterium sp. Sd200 TaxID=2692211 RepID=UPI00136B9620|nr:hypothetical protein [Flavobacterium sp. Sd200]MXN91287.1 hypothetical protein [Flavobacterium sp. Sd200]